jgi:hypothetical protein
MLRIENIKFRRFFTLQALPQFCHRRSVIISLVQAYEVAFICGRQTRQSGRRI